MTPTLPTLPRTVVCLHCDARIRTVELDRHLRWGWGCPRLAEKRGPG